MVHKHAAQIVDWAQNGTLYEAQIAPDKPWVTPAIPSWDENYLYRRADLNNFQKSIWEAAHSNDKKVEFKSFDGQWADAKSVIDNIDSFPYHTITNPVRWRIVPIIPEWQTKLRQAVKNGDRVLFKSSYGETWASSYLNDISDPDKFSFADTTEDRYRVIEAQWKTELREAVKEGKTVQTNINNGVWLSSLINTDPDGYVFGTMSKDSYRIVEAKWQRDLRQAVRDGERIEFNASFGGWGDCTLNQNPDRLDVRWHSPDRYRIVKKPTFFTKYMELRPDGGMSPATSYRGSQDNLKITYDAETHEVVAAELIK